jgi:hypothetical protein
MTLLAAVPALRHFFGKPARERTLAEGIHVLEVMAGPTMPLAALTVALAPHTKVDGRTMSARHFAGRPTDAVRWLLFALRSTLDDFDNGMAWPVSHPAN